MCDRNGCPLTSSLFTLVYTEYDSSRGDIDCCIHPPFTIIDYHLFCTLLFNLLCSQFFILVTPLKFVSPYIMSGIF